MPADGLDYRISYYTTKFFKTAAKIVKGKDIFVQTSIFFLEFSDVFISIFVSAFKNYYLYPKLIIMEEIYYQSPAVRIIEIYSEGVLCGSNETLEEDQGIW